MKYIRSIPYLLLAMLLTAKSLLSLDTSSVKYLPLKTGNVWVYDYFTNYPPPNGTHYRLRATIDRDTMIGSKRYFHNSGLPIFYGINMYPYTWLRFDSSNGNLSGITYPQCSTNILLVDSLASGLNNIAYLCHSPDTLPRICDYTGTVTFCSQSNIIKWFNSVGLVWVFRREYIKYFGIYFAVYGELNPQSYSLLGSIIDGVLCGDTSLTGIDVISEGIPKEFNLCQNYPNPFNPVTKINYELPITNYVRLVIYDVMGKEVEVLVNEFQKPGKYQVEWDGSNYASGMYLYKLTTKDFSQTKKLVLLK